MIYAVVTFKPLDGLTEKIQHLDPRAYVDGSPPVHFLSFSGTAK